MHSNVISIVVQKEIQQQQQHKKAQKRQFQEVGSNWKCGMGILLTQGCLAGY